jgi:hypothetical protein
MIASSGFWRSEKKKKCKTLKRKKRNKTYFNGTVHNHAMADHVLDPQRELVRFLSAYAGTVSRAATPERFEPIKMHASTPMPPPTRFVRRKHPKNIPQWTALQCEVAPPKATNPKCEASPPKATTVASLNLDVASPVRADSWRTSKRTAPDAGAGGTTRRTVLRWTT